MKKHRKLKILSILAVTFVSGLFISSSTSAWGPERDTFTMKSPATYPTFNSITDNPTIGDERNFVRIGEINADETNLGDEVEVVPGRQYLVYIYFHNNASATFNDKAHNYSGVAENTRMSTNYSNVLTPSDRGVISATISADNANPKSVWDEAYMTTKTNKVIMSYVPGSSRIYNDWKLNDSIVPLNLFTEKGVLLGLNGFNGVILGCEEYHGVVTYVLQADELGGSITKTVSKDGADYKESVSVKTGDEVYFELALRNTGDIGLTNAVVKDSLPEGLELISGSVTLRANDSAEKDQLTDDLINNGYNLGRIGTGNVVYLNYRAKVTKDYDCGDSGELTNEASLTYDSDLKTGDTRKDSATVVIEKEACDVPNDEEAEEIIEDIINPKKDCTTNPEMEECKELPKTGPVEIILATIIVLGILGGGYYFLRTKMILRKVEDNVSGKDNLKDNTSSQKPDNMVK